MEKPSATSLLRREPDSGSAQGRQAPPRVQVELVSRDDTAGFDPMWDGPRLLPTFVAQVMGQVLPERRHATLLETPYGSARDARMALLVDRKS